MTNKLDALEVYERYTAIKLHFTTKGYDFHKYAGKVKGTTRANFEKRRDKYFFHRLSSKYRPNQMNDFLVANMLAEPKVFVGDLLTDEAEAHFKAYMKRKQSITQTFKDDLDNLFGQVDEPIDALMIEDGQNPLIIKEIIAGRFNIESLVILNDVIAINYFGALDSKLIDDMFWPSIKLKAEKLQPFMVYPKRKTKEVVKRFLQDRKNA